MNKYLIAALYVVAGCVVTLPAGARIGATSVGTDSYRLIVSTTERIVTVAGEKKSIDEMAYGLFDGQNFLAVSGLAADNSIYSSEVLQGFKVPDVTANPIRAPGSRS